ncbi:MAG: hypothetical protein U1C74_05820, partial [Phenylobacterium sp.]|nr:hypothetical protein [Phenylobacterium sp.]
ARGRLGDLDLFVEGAGVATGVGMTWGAVGAEIPYDLVGALRVRGATVEQRACEKIGTGEGSQRLAGALPGRAPFTITVEQRTAPTGAAQSYYAATLSLDGRQPPRGDTSGCDFLR